MEENAKYKRDYWAENLKIYHHQVAFLHGPVPSSLPTAPSKQDTCFFAFSTFAFSSGCRALPQFYSQFPIQCRFYQAFFFSVPC